MAHSTLTEADRATGNERKVKGIRETSARVL